MFGDFGLAQYQRIVRIALVRPLHLRLEAATAQINVDANTVDLVAKLLGNCERLLYCPVAYGNEVKHIVGVDEEDDFLPAYDGPFFASAGKDQRWGMRRKRRTTESDASWDAYKLTDDYIDALDNLYSFDLDGSESARGD